MRPIKSKDPLPARFMIVLHVLIQPKKINDVPLKESKPRISESFAGYDIKSLRLLTKVVGFTKQTAIVLKNPKS